MVFDAPIQFDIITPSEQDRALQLMAKDGPPKLVVFSDNDDNSYNCLLLSQHNRIYRLHLEMVLPKNCQNFLSLENDHFGNVNDQISF